MSAIGDYIHFSQRGYLQHGIARKGKSKAISNLEVMRQNVTTLAKQRLKYKNEEKTRQTLNNLENLAASIMNPSNSTYAIQRQAIEDYLLKQFPNKIKSIDWNTGTIEPTDNIDAAIGKIHGEYRIDGNGKRYRQLKGTIENLAKKMETLTAVLAKEIENATEPAHRKVLETQLKELQKLYSDSLAKTDEEAKALGLPSAKIPKSSGSFVKFVELANQLIETYAPMPPIYLYEGTLWEAVIAAIKTTGVGIAGKEVYSMIERAVVGANNIDISKDFNTYLASEVAKKTFEGVQLELSRDIARRKTDVEFKWEEEDLKISAKNIRISSNSYKWVSAVSDAPLSDLFNDSLPANFINVINHYLNIYTYHSKDNKMGSDVEVSTKLTPNLSINDTIKSYLFFSSLSGKREGDVANIFAVHDKNGKGIKFVLMSDLIDQLANKTNQLSVKLNSTPIRDFYFRQKWVEKMQNKKPEYQRIAALTAELHKIKVKAMFNVIRILY